LSSEWRNLRTLVLRCQGFYELYFIAIAKSDIVVLSGAKNPGVEIKTLRFAQGDMFSKNAFLVLSSSFATTISRIIEKFPAIIPAGLITGGQP
jgi:hypothetical protein